MNAIHHRLGAKNSSATFIDNSHLTGEVIAVRGPGSFTLLGLALFCATLRRSMLGGEVIPLMWHTQCPRVRTLLLLAPGVASGQESGTSTCPILTQSRTCLRCGGTLYNLADDIDETMNVAADQPEIVKQLMNLINEVRADIGYHHLIGKIQAEKTERQYKAVTIGRQHIRAMFHSR